MWTLLPLPYRIGAILLLCLGLFASGFGVGYMRERDALVAYQAKVDQQTADQAAQVAAINAQHKIDLTNAEAQHVKDQAVIDDLTTKLVGVRIHIPLNCNSGKGKAATDTDGAAGILSDRTDAAFARLQSGFDRLVRRCDQLNIDAIKLNGSL